MKARGSEGPAVRQPATAGRFLIVVRHGQTSWNAAGRFQGRADPPLDTVGQRQAAECAARLVCLFDREGIPVARSRILSSDLRRAADTASAIAAALGLAVDEDPLLREVDVGGWEGLTRSEARQRFPDEYRRWMAGCDIRRGGGETLRQAGQRVAARIAPELAAPSGAVIAVGHGMALQAGLGQLRAGGHIAFLGDAPHLGNGQWLAVPPPGTGPPPTG